MRISDAAKVTVLPKQTIKDLRQSGVLKMGVSDSPGESKDVRQWGSFSVPNVMVLTAAKLMRTTYGMMWPGAIEFAENALQKVNIPNVGTVDLKFFDLRGYDGEVWVGRVEFEHTYPFAMQDWPYFACALAEVANAVEKAVAKRNDQIASYEQENNCTIVDKAAPIGVTLLNASRLCKDVFAKLNVLRCLNRFDQPRITARLASMPVVEGIVELLQQRVKERNISHRIPCQLLEAFGVVEREARPIEQSAMLFRMQEIGQIGYIVANIG